MTNARAYTQTFTAYDALSRRTVVTDADGLVTRYFYDGLNRLVEIQYPDATVEYAYDALGRCIAMTDTSGVTTYQYDDLGRLVRVTDPFTGVVEYAYDLAGNRTALTVTHNAQPTTTYYAFDAGNRLIQVTDWATGTTTYAYDSAGRLSATTLPNGVVTTHSYDPASRLTALTHTHNGALLARYAYTLDATGNRTRVTETVSGVTRGISYTYDSLYRLTAADYSTGEYYAYQYDPVGNREVMTDTAVHTYVYDAANRLTNADGVVHTWDNRGNLLADGTFTYTYSAAGRMVRAENLTATLVYTYNADGLRVAQAQSVSSVQSVDTFTWDWATPVPEMLSDGESLYLIGYDTLGWQNGVTWTFVLPDALGSVRQETDGAGVVTATREWSPYGEELGGAQGGVGFTGEWFDANVGLTYLRARWYDGTTGRFTQVDPWEGDKLHPFTQQPYIYALADPINKLDPTGHVAIPGWYFAVAYALEHWDDPWPYGTETDYANLDFGDNGDCTNFVSQALWAGGLRDHRDPQDTSLAPKYWYAEAAKTTSYDSDRARTWVWAPDLYTFLTQVLRFTEHVYPPAGSNETMPYVNGKPQDSECFNENWMRFLLNANVKPGDVVFYYQSVAGYNKEYVPWTHTALVVGWGPPTFFPDNPIPPSVFSFSGIFPLKPLVVEHSTAFSRDMHLNPRSIDNMSYRAEEISIVNVRYPMVTFPW
ncbi:MAG: RHS repeat-associated core domain-containing protein [Anaerolineae bacterium]